ncbi:MAG: polysaccharide deacetylase family protein, partial [Pseudorhodoplanes sp.]
MRASLACTAFVSATLAASAASAQLIPSSSRTTGASSATAAPSATAPAAAPAPLAPPPTRAACTNPDAIGIARTVEIDTTGGPGFGFEHFRQHDFLRTKEVVLTFDDGPWLET